MNPFRFKVFARYAVSSDSLYTDDSGKYWGNQGAGGVFYAEDTKRLGFPKRSEHVNEPNVWGTWGGAVEEGETPEEALKREVEEEAGYRGPMKLKELYVFTDNKFKYTNFLILVPKEFKPILNWETSAFTWVSVDEVPTPRHPGLQKLLPHLKKYLLEGGRP